MAKLYPWDARDRGGADLSEIFGSVVGEFVREIRYVVPHGEDWPEGHGESRVHEVDMAVELVMESGFSVVLSWEMDGPSEGLAIESKNSTELDELPGDGIDVSGHAD